MSHSSFTIIAPAGGPRLNLKELWAYRDLLYFLVRRDIRVRYAQTVVGAGWAILQPLLTMAVFTVIFGNFARIPSDGVPYATFSLAALVPWTYFATALTGATGSLVSSANLLTKVYFPRFIIPLTPVIASLVDLAVAFVMLLGIALATGQALSPTGLIVLPLMVAVMAITAAGAGCWLSALNIQYRDVKYVVPFIMQIWMFGSPIVYPASIVPESWRLLYMLNPMAGVIETFRAAILGTNPVAWSLIGMSAAGGLVLLITGTMYFTRTEQIFADVV